MQLSTDGGSWQTVYSHGGSVWGTDGRPLIVSLSGRAARFVRLQLAEDNYMNIAEVEVYGQSAVAAPDAPVPPVIGTPTTPTTGGMSGGSSAPAGAVRNLALNQPTRESSVYNDNPTMRRAE